MSAYPVTDWIGILFCHSGNKIIFIEVEYINGCNDYSLVSFHNDLKGFNILWQLILLN